MQAWVFAGVLSVLFAVLAYRGTRRADQRGLVLIAITVLAALDIWVAQTPRVQAAVTTGGKLADLMVITAFGHKFGGFDVAVAVAIVAAIGAIGSTLVTVLAALFQIAAFTIGLAIARLLGVPLPGTPFILVFALPFLCYTHREWAKMPAGDKLITAIVCSVAMVFAAAGILMAMMTMVDIHRLNL